ncbi:gamma-glutamyl hydrolase A [Hydra vulgaris]|uniref:folate gamma-glutamyl hydrolase n=1 Tax=Hydra vulgaris TaxID=6087 RepID=T2M871_HYDVU|nr:gamma-glutamyl hydrolase A [Hydra vulgaris]
MALFGMVFVLLSVFTLPNESLINDRPIIAVLAQLSPVDNHYSYIAASYVKYLESAGARVVPIPASMTADEVSKLFNYVNGVLYPGGSTTWFTSGYYKHAKIFHDLAIKANKNGDYFPVWGTCLGFETLHVIATESGDVLTNFAAEDISLALNFTPDASTSRLFSGIDKNLFKALSAENITYNHHSYGISPKEYTVRSTLKSFYKVLSTNKDVNGLTFVSSIEAYDYPFYGTQWHPEKNAFEFSQNEQLPHSVNAVRMAQYVANFFVDESRKNSHKFPSAKLEQDYLIYNYNPVYTGGKEGRLTNFEQVYLFPETPHNEI